MKPFHLVIALFFFLLPHLAMANGEDDLVIASQMQSENITKKELRKYLSGQRPSWPDGTAVTIVLFPKASVELKWLCKNIIKLPVATYRRFVMQKAFRSGIKIIEVQNPEEAKAVLLKTPGAISPLHQLQIEENIHPMSISE